MRRILAGTALLALAVAAGPALGADLTAPEISAAVEDEILTDPAVSLNDVEVETKDGVVLLSGTTDNLLEKQRATRLAELVRGVRAVVNEMEVVPPVTRSDVDTAQDIRSALLYDRATDSYEITVAVEEGRATLTGTVDSWREKDLAATVAAGVRGVTEVDNRISIEYGDEREDAEIQAEIEAALRWDTRVDDSLVEVAVDSGRVTLSGTVGSAAEKMQARADAWVYGVEAIDASRLDVARWARDDDLRAEKYVPKPDEEIRDAVLAALLHDPRVYSFEIPVSVQDGIVTLSGKVDSLSAKRAAEMDARHTVGVLDVKNRIRVGLTAPSDDRIADNIRDALRRDPWLERREMDVEVVHGTVTLRGAVDTYFEKARADGIASRSHGVIEVRNLLDVEYDQVPLTYVPLMDDYDHWVYVWYDYRPAVTYKPDRVIKKHIDNEIWWSPFIDSEDVSVSVENGVATLTGTVETLAERRAATERAFDGGAVWVDNDLVVE